MPEGPVFISCSSTSPGASITGLGRCALWWRAVASSMAAVIFT